MSKSKIEQLVCYTCTRPVAAPFRRYNKQGEVVEGCVDASHDGHLYGESLRWHNRPVAKQIRKQTRDRLREILKREKRGT